MAQKPPGGAPFWVTPTLRDRKTWTFAEEMKERAEAVMRMVPYAVAVELKKGLLARIPNKPDFKEYRDALTVVEVAGGKPGKQAAFSLHAASKARKIKKTDIGKTVIYVRQNKSRNTPPDPAVKILEDSGPWTADTIPFWPPKSVAVVVQRKVSRREADKVATARKKEWPKVRREMEKVGRRMPTKKKAPGQLKRNQKAIPDLAMLALSLEFGEGSRKANPAWRKTLNEIKTTLKRLPKKEKRILNAWADPNDSRWKGWPKAGEEISPSQAMKYMGFQSRLGYGQ